MKYSLQKWKADVERYAIQKQDGEGKEINNQELIGDLTPLDPFTRIFNILWSQNFYLIFLHIITSI